MDNPTIVFDRPRSAVIEPRERPRPAAGEVLIETALTLISTGTELTIYSGDFPERSVWAQYGRFPFVAGYSNVGRVAEAGAGVDPAWLGRRVASRGPHAAWVTARPAALAPIPDEVPDQEAALFALAAIVMNSIRRAHVTWGETIVVNGCGLLGQLAVRLAVIAGASRVVAADVSEYRLALLPKSPAVLALNPRRDDVRARVREANRGRLADVVFEVTGDPALIEGELASLRRQGRFIVLSSPRGASSFDFHDLCNAPSFTIIGTHETSHPAAATPDNPWTHVRHNELFFDYLAGKRIEVGSLLSHRFAYAKAPEVYAQLIADRSAYMGVILDWRERASQ
ncbi:MAG TPA: zinc-binding dehydrogenase [Candidatus Binataceae bacterium]